MIWQDVCKPGEWSPTEGRWFARRSHPSGHTLNPALGPFATREEAEAHISTEAA